MKAPEFWRRPGVVPSLLAPLSSVYGALSDYRRGRATPYQSSLPVICIGNLVAGGAGKTPTAIWLCDALTRQGYRPGILSRGYGGRLIGPVKVDPGEQTSLDVGDEPLLLAQRYPTWISKDRAVGAKVMEASDIDIIVMDDGFQNAGLVKDFSILVVDGGYGFGNGRIIPAGPLRETVAGGLARADHVVFIGEDESGVVDQINGAKPVSSGMIMPEKNEVSAACDYIAFCGIGRPEKFFATLRQIGAQLIETHSYADHHAFSVQEISHLKYTAKLRGVGLVTTEKDFVRIPASDRGGIEVLKIQLVINDQDDLLNQIKEALPQVS